MILSPLKVRCSKRLFMMKVKYKFPKDNKWKKNIYNIKA